MKNFARAISLALLSCICMVAMSSTASAAGKDQAVQLLPPEQYASDRIIIKFKKGIASAAANHLLAAAGVQNQRTLNSVGMSVLTLVKGKGVKSALAALKKSGLVEFAEPDRLLHIALTPNDPSYPLLWGMNNTGQTGGTPNADIDADLAWNVTTGDPNVVVAVIDTGVDYTHPDLAANIWTNPGEIAGNLIDDDGNGYIDDVHGINSITGTGDPMDDHYHGTHVSGTIGAVGNNGVGVVGVNHQVKIMGLKFLNAAGSGSTIDAVECLNYAAMMKTTYGVNLKLTSNSWGGGGFDPALLAAIQANNAADILFIAAAGNNATNNDLIPSYPSNYDSPNVVAVEATDHNDILAWFSQYGATTVDLAAPGVSIYSTMPGNTYGYLDGTSMATPHVSGAAALVWASNPAATGASVKALLMGTVDVIPSLAGTSVTGGRLNVNNAITCVPGTPTLNISSPANGFAVDVGVATAVSVNISDCGAPQLGATVTVTPTNGDTAFTLLDNGVAPDAVANDGIYSANWMPINAGAVTLNVAATGGFGTLNGTVSGTANVAINYVIKSIPFQWIDISATGTIIGPLADDQAAVIPIGFTFNHYGAPKTSVYVSSNGYLAFNANATSYQNVAIPTNTIPNDIIAPFWDDLNPGIGGQVMYLVEGVAPNRRLTVAWIGVPHFGGLATEAATFEVTLYEGTDQIVMRYLDTVFGGSQAVNDNGGSASVGVENVDGTRGTQFSYLMPVVTSNSSILLKPAGASTVVDIKANGSDALIIVTPTTPVNVTISLAGGALPAPTELWLWAERNGAYYWYVHPTGWTPSATPLAAFTGTPVNLNGYSVSTRTLPVGSYSFNFGADGNADGVLDATHIDWVNLTSQ